MKNLLSENKKENKLSDIEKIISFLDKKNINMLIVHGLASSNHTHKYIHQSIYKTFKYIKKYMIKISMLFGWMIKYKIFTKMKKKFLIFSSPHYDTDNFLPILNNAYYILHYRDENFIKKQLITKYKKLLDDNKAVKYIEFRNKNNNKKNVRNTIFYHNEKGDNSLTIPWATDLLPHEIDDKINLIKSLKKLSYVSKNSYFCGTIWHRNVDTMIKWKNICLKYGIIPHFVREK